MDHGAQGCRANNIQASPKTPTCWVSRLGLQNLGLLYGTRGVQRRAETPHGRQLMQILPGPSADGSEPATASARGNTQGVRWPDDLENQSALSGPAPQPACAPRSRSPAAATPRPAGTAPPAISAAPGG